MFHVLKGMGASRQEGLEGEGHWEKWQILRRESMVWDVEREYWTPHDYYA